MVDSDVNENKNRWLRINVTPFLPIVFVVVLFCILIIIYLTDTNLPKIVGDEEEENAEAFIAYRAISDLKTLTDFGPRITGSYENEVLTVNFLKRKIQTIIENAHKNHFIELDVQVVTGSYPLSGTINSYSAIQNIVVKLSSDNSTRHAVLVNVHFDSVPTSPGGSDDGINCVVLLEVLRRLTKFPRTYKHNIIFLFNGAEETPLQASHGFISQHKWAKEVVALINLEAAGAGGKLMLFQTGPKQQWLLKYVARMPRIRANVISEELFQLGLIPSDTDFRIFRDFGGVIGLDFAITEDGYRYHTKYDGFSNIPHGAYQYNGDNVLSLVRSLADAEELSGTLEETGDAIYFDIFGVFLIWYTDLFAIIAYWIIFFVSHMITLKAAYDFNIGSVMYYLIVTGQVLSGYVLSGLVAVCIALIIDAVDYPLSWYANPWIVLGLYVVPVMASACVPFALFNPVVSKKFEVNANVQVQVQLHIQRTIMVVILLVGTTVGLRSVYLIFVSVIFQILAFGVMQLTSLYPPIKTVLTRVWPIVFIICTIIPTILLMDVFQLCTRIYIPMLGRIGARDNPELLICLIVILGTILITTVYTPFVTLIRQPYVFLVACLVVFITFLIIVFTPAGFPYSGDKETPRPQRFWIYHMSRKFRDELNNVYKDDTGIFLAKKDRNTPSSIEAYVHGLANTISIEDDCKKVLYCGLPFARNGDDKPHLSVWVPTPDKPKFSTETKLELLLKKTVKTSTKTALVQFVFKASGPNRLEIPISAKPHCNVFSISLVQGRPVPQLMWNDRPLYVIVHGSAKENNPLVFSIGVETPLHWSEAVLDIGVIGRYVDNRINENQMNYKNFLKDFPEWADVTDWLAASESWVY